MQRQLPSQPLSHFYVIGINYKETEASIRGLFSIEDVIYSRIRKSFSGVKAPEIYLLSTCNRTEVYGFCEDPVTLAELLCKETKGEVNDFLRTAYILNGEDAIRHLYGVCCGLDSQILGDFEITSQVKIASNKSREAGLLGPFLERLINSVLQTSKRVKTKTGLSSGTTSVSFAAIKYLQRIPDIKNKRILLFGLGKIGRVTCKNLQEYIGTKNIVLVNRTKEIAEDFAGKHGLQCAPIEDLKIQIRESDVILVATNASKPTVNKEVMDMGKKIFLDLSIPKNVSDEIKSLPQVSIVDVDELSVVSNKTRSLRAKEIPKAEAIIEEGMADFMAWHRNRKNAFILQRMKEKMEEVQCRGIGNYRKEKEGKYLEDKEMAAYLAQKIINVFGGKLKEVEGQPDHYYQVLGELFDLPVNKEQQ